MWKRFVNDYLGYTYKERIGIFAVLALTTMGIGIPFFYSFLVTKKQYDRTKFDSAIAGLQMVKSDSFTNKRYYTKNADEDNFTEFASPSEKEYYPKAATALFYFDPNTATAADWKRLGVKDKTAETIEKYLSKGGHFYKPEDISKIWGLHPADIKRLLPYVNINKPENAKKEESNFTETKKPFATKAIQLLEINTADTAAFIALPGIGSKLAQRIVNFRDKLGGFYSVDQVGETYGLPDSTFQKIKSKLICSNSAVKKININTASVDDLKSHPYIRYTIANAIIQYRSQHGNFSTVADLRKIMLITDDVFKKMAAYVSAGE